VSPGLVYDRGVRHRDAVALLAPAGLDSAVSSIWLDLGAGDGTFTLALADLLGAGSVIHAIDEDRAALSRIPRHATVRIESHVADFTMDSWPVRAADGILMANSLHYVTSQRAFLESCVSRLMPGGEVVVVEYDLDRANPWVPYPVNRATLMQLAQGLGVVSFVASRPSVYQRAPLYVAVLRPRAASRHH
jgi:trans-aconitate methyltransferase